MLPTHRSIAAGIERLWSHVARFDSAEDYRLRQVLELTAKAKAMHVRDGRPEFAQVLEGAQSLALAAVLGRRVAAFDPREVTN